MVHAAHAARGGRRAWRKALARQCSPVHCAAPARRDAVKWRLTTSPAVQDDGDALARRRGPNHGAMHPPSHRQLVPPMSMEEDVDRNARRSAQRPIEVIVTDACTRRCRSKQSGRRLRPSTFPTPTPTMESADAGARVRKRTKKARPCLGHPMHKRRRRREATQEGRIQIGAPVYDPRQSWTTRGGRGAAAPRGGRRYQAAAVVECEEGENALSAQGPKWKAKGGETGQQDDGGARLYRHAPERAAAVVEGHGAVATDTGTIHEAAASSLRIEGIERRRLGLMAARSVHPPLFHPCRNNMTRVSLTRKRGAQWLRPASGADGTDAAENIAEKRKGGRQMRDGPLSLHVESASQLKIRSWPNASDAS
ncbi:hypothetical protein GGX14DRAFT_562967 [Mycena pura]|uniref:Uncharacterized protein n=1 Tax=Mycena pura TaxID=153505 RepID=A0AAD6VKN4_9AGAR|nr:hypothetical protein GGX14DRAFT_562967 [Mycena pura]